MDVGYKSGVVYDVWVKNGKVTNEDISLNADPKGLPERSADILRKVALDLDRFGRRLGRRKTSFGNYIVYAPK